MNSWQRINTIVKYAWFHLNHSMETWVDLIWSPIIQIVLFGLIASFFQSASHQFSNVLMMGFIAWQVVSISQYSITVGVMWDVWSHNFSSLFVTPLNMRELIAGQALFGVVKAFGIVIILALIAFLFFDFNILQLSFMLPIYFAPLSIFGFSIGIFITALILRFGTDIQSLSWSLIYVFQPISAIFFPVEALPQQVRWIAYISPITFSMEAARNQLNTGRIDWTFVAISFAIASLYLLICSFFLALLKKQAQKSGAFARMEV